MKVQLDIKKKKSKTASMGKFWSSLVQDNVFNSLRPG